MQFPATVVQLAESSPPPSSQSKLLDWIYPFHATLVQLAEKHPLPPAARLWTFFDLIYNLSISCNFQQLWISWQWPDCEHFLDWIYPFHAISSNFGSDGRKAPPPHSAFHEIPSSYHTCRIPMHPILQIHTLIPPIWISSLSYQLCQLFKILTYIEVQDTGSWCRWKTCSQPYHNTH